MENENIILRVPPNQDPELYPRFDGEPSEVEPGKSIYSELFKGTTCNFRRLEGITENDGGEAKAVFEFYGVTEPDRSPAT